MSRRGENIYLRKDGLYEARYVKEIDVYGKKKYGSVYSRSYREVKAKRQDALDNLLLNQKPISLRNMTIAELTEEWLYINKSRLKLSTYQRYCGLYNKHIKDSIGGIRIIFFSAISVREFALKLESGGLRAQSANCVLIFLHSVLKYGHQQYNLPLPVFKYFQTEQKEMRVLSREEQSKLVAYLKKDIDVYKLGVLISLYTGIRVGELCALQWGDIEENCIKIRRTMLRLQRKDGKGTEIYVGPPKTRKSIRIIPIMSGLVDIIFQFKEQRAPDSYVLGVPGYPVVEPRVMQYKFKSYMQDLQIKNTTFHTLRHTFSTRAIEAGVDIRSLCELLWHSNVQTSLNRYVHSSLSQKRESIEKLTSFF